MISASIHNVALLLFEDKNLKKYNFETREFESIDLNKSKIGPIEFDIIIFDMDAQILNFANSVVFFNFRI